MSDDKGFCQTKRLAMAVAANRVEPSRSSRSLVAPQTTPEAKSASTTLSTGENRYSLSVAPPIRSDPPSGCGAAGGTNSGDGTGWDAGLASVPSQDRSHSPMVSSARTKGRKAEPEPLCHVLGDDFPLPTKPSWVGSKLSGDDSGI